MGDSASSGLEQRKRAASSTNSNPRSAVSAAVSDESVAGDSGVFEAAQHRKQDLTGLAMSLETAQVQVKLRYSRQEDITALYEHFKAYRTYPYHTITLVLTFCNERFFIQRIHTGYKRGPEFL
jgi:hypothetical protein